jgi:hypothetical protein
MKTIFLSTLILSLILSCNYTHPDSNKTSVDTTISIVIDTNKIDSLIADTTKK